MFTYAREKLCGIRVNMTYALSLKSEKHDPLSGKGRKFSLRPVTGRQLEVLVYLRSYISAYRCSPVVREVCAFFGIGSPQGAQRHLQVLVRKGMTIPTGHGQSRGYQLTAAGLAATEGRELAPLPGPNLRQCRRTYKPKAAW